MTDDPLLNWDRRTDPVPERVLTSRLRQVAKGAMGEVHDVIGARPPCLYKRYKQPELHATRLSYLIGWRRSLNAGERRDLDQHCAWPIVAVINDARDIAGFLMIPATPEFWFRPAKPAGSASPLHPNELSYLLQSNEKARIRGVQLPDAGQRLDLLEDLARIFDLFDANEIVYGDFSDKNMMWTLSPHPRIFLIDCDNARPARLPGEHAGVAMATSTGIWHDPAVPSGGFPGVESDRFALAMFCYRVYYKADWELSYEGDNRELPLPADAPIVPLQRVLEGGLSEHPSARPPAADWRRAVAATRAALDRRGQEPEPASATTLSRPWPGLIWIAVSVILLAAVVFLIVSRA